MTSVWHVKDYLGSGSRVMRGWILSLRQCWVEKVKAVTHALPSRR